MKLRIQGNSIRLRLTQAEVQHIAEGKTVKEHVSFGSGTPVFIYALGVASEEAALTAHYQGHTMQVVLPPDTAHAWATTDQVGIEETLPVDGSGALHVLIEKDFQCLHRSDEEEPDNFPYPLATPAQ